MDCIAGESQRLLVVSRPAAKLGEVPAHMRHRRPQSRRFDRQSLDLVQEQEQEQEPAATDESSKGQGNNVDHGKGAGVVVACFMHLSSCLCSAHHGGEPLLPPRSLPWLTRATNSLLLCRASIQETMTSTVIVVYYFHGSVR